MFRPVVLTLVLVATAGCTPGPEAIDPARVLDLQQLLRRDGMSITLFGYDDSDARGWPADPGHQRFVRFLQDGGVTVAFTDRDPESGLRYAQFGRQDAETVFRLNKLAREQGIFPDLIPKPAEKDKR